MDRQLYLEMFQRAAQECRKLEVASRMWMDVSSSGTPRYRISRPEIGSACGPAGAGFMLNPLGRSPDSRFIGPAAFPFLAGTVACLTGPPRSQWRGPAGVFTSSPYPHPRGLSDRPG